MDRRSVLTVGAVVAVTAASWTASIVYDVQGLQADSYQMGRQWAQQYEPDFAGCEARMFQIMGPKVNGAAWLAGCESVLTDSMPPG